MTDTSKRNEDIAEQAYKEMSETEWFKTAMAHDIQQSLRYNLSFNGEIAPVWFKREITKLLNTKDREREEAVAEAVRNNKDMIARHIREWGTFAYTDSEFKRLVLEYVRDILLTTPQESITTPSHKEHE